MADLTAAQTGRIIAGADLDYQRECQRGETASAVQILERLGGKVADPSAMHWHEFVLEHAATQVAIEAKLRQSPFAAGVLSCWRETIEAELRRTLLGTPETLREQVAEYRELRDPEQIGQVFARRCGQELNPVLIAWGAKLHHIAAVSTAELLDRVKFVEKEAGPTGCLVFLVGLGALAVMATLI